MTPLSTHERTPSPVVALPAADGPRDIMDYIDKDEDEDDMDGFIVDKDNVGAAHRRISMIQDSIETLLQKTLTPQNAIRQSAGGDDRHRYRSLFADSGALFAELSDVGLGFFVCTMIPLLPYLFLVFFFQALVCGMNGDSIRFI